MRKPVTRSGARKTRKDLGVLDRSQASSSEHSKSHRSGGRALPALPRPVCLLWQRPLAGPPSRHPPPPVPIVPAPLSPSYISTQGSMAYPSKQVRCLHHPFHSNFFFRALSTAHSDNLFVRYLFQLEYPVGQNSGNWFCIYTASTCYVTHYSCSTSISFNYHSD